MPAYHTIERKTELIIAAYLDRLADKPLANVQFQGRFSPAHSVQPYLKIMCPRAEFEGQNLAYQTGNAWVDVSLELVSNYADTPPEVHDEYMGYVTDNFLSLTAVTELNAVEPGAAWKCFSVIVQERENMVEEHTYTTTLKMRMKCAPSRVA